MKTIKTWLIGLALGLTTVVSAQTVLVSGKIVDAKNRQPLAGVSVIVKGTSLGTVSDTAGIYNIKTEMGKTLVFNLIGYMKKEMCVKGPMLDIYLNENLQILSETKVIGYGNASALQGRVAGVNAVGAATGYFKSQNRLFTKSQNCVSQTVFYGGNTVADTEEYGGYKENRFFSAKDQALSTFSLDVDAASYGNMRRMINQGQLPVKDAIRTEELINYFSYSYPQPTGKDPVKIVTETAVCPWAPAHQLVRIGVKAREIPSENRAATNFVFLLDVSGSMNDANKLDLVKSSIKLLTNNLRDKDRVAIVTYAGSAGLALPSTEGTDKQKIMEAVDNLQAGGSTAGGAGIELGYKVAEKNFIRNGNNRIILCTDGDFNVGVSETGGLENLIESKRKTGIYLTVLGYGMGNYKDNKLQALAEKGNGNHAYIDNLQEANKVLVNEFGSTMYTVAKDVKIQVEFNPAYVNAYRLIGYESRLLNKEDFNDDTKDAGELGSGHTVTALYEIIPVGVKNNFGGVDDLKYQKNNNSNSDKNVLISPELLTVKLRYKLPDGNSSEKMEVPVLANDINKKPTDDFQFVMAVSMFGQLLRASDFKGDSSYLKVIELANQGIGTDTHGYRREFVRLVESVNQLTK